MSLVVRCAKDSGHTYTSGVLAEFYRLHLKSSLHVHDELKESARIC